MSQLPMPSEVRKLSADHSGGASRDTNAPEAAESVVVEPPSVKLIVRLFVIPLLIVAGAVGVMFVIGLLAGKEPTLEEAVARLRSPGGQRTVSHLVGPASKQRYLDAKTLVDKMKSPQGMTEAERITLASQLIDILNNHTTADEGEVQHFVLLALGRTWQRHPSQPAMNSPAAVESRRQVLATLERYADAAHVATRKAAVLAKVYLAGHDEQPDAALPKLVQKLSDEREDIDVRIAAATALGPLAAASDATAIEALRRATRDSDPRHAELVWSAALSLAQLDQPEVADTILKLLDRGELSKLEYYDREKDPGSPTFRKLNDQEQQRILINTMLGARKLDVPQVQQRLRELAQSDPSPRVRAAGMEILGGGM
jgi:hypothetical protein